MHTRTIYFALICLLLFSCDSNSLDTLIEEHIDERVEDTEIDRTVVDQATRLTNLARSVRQQCGDRSFDATYELTWNDQLAEAALAHSQDMATRNYFDHTSPSGENPGARINRTGYVASTWGENIAAGYGSVEQAIQGWINSPGHCANIMNSNFTEFAVAIAQSNTSTYGNYWTMVLAAPR